MHDSGSRDTFSTGCVRDNGEKKPRPDLISPFAKFRLGDWLRKGAEKYDERNWEKGMSISRCLEAIDRHYCQYQMGMKNEDHMAAVMCNAMFILHYEEMIKRGVLPPSLNDMPDYSLGIQVRKASQMLLPLVTKKLDGARLPYEKKIAKAVEKAADRMANLKKRVNEATIALMKELNDFEDKSYGMELDSQNPVGLNPILADHYPTDNYTGKPMIPKPQEVDQDRRKMGQVHNKGARALLPPVSKVTGQSIADRVIKQFNKVYPPLVIPDDNKVSPIDQSYFKPVCCICGGHNIKFYRQDLKRSYCTNCYHFNRIDLKPVINWS